MRIIFKQTIVQITINPAAFSKLVRIYNNKGINLYNYEKAAFSGNNVAYARILRFSRRNCG